jgi:hypothetical protein
VGVVQPLLDQMRMTGAHVLTCVVGGLP